MVMLCKDEDFSYDELDQFHLDDEGLLSDDDSF